MRPSPEIDGWSSRDIARARANLARILPWPEWIAAKRPSPEHQRMWRYVVAEYMKLAVLTPDEERLVRTTLGLDAEDAAVEETHVGA